MSVDCGIVDVDIILSSRSANSPPSSSSLHRSREEDATGCEYEDDGRCICRLYREMSEGMKGVIGMQSSVYML